MLHNGQDFARKANPRFRAHLTSIFRVGEQREIDACVILSICKITFFFASPRGEDLAARIKYHSVETHSYAQKESAWCVP